MKTRIRKGNSIKNSLNRSGCPRCFFRTDDDAVLKPISSLFAVYFIICIQGIIFAKEKRCAFLCSPLTISLFFLSPAGLRLALPAAAVYTGQGGEKQ